MTRYGKASNYTLVPHPRYLFKFGDQPATLVCTYGCSGLTAYGAVWKVLSRVDGRALVIIGLGGVGFAALRLAQAITTASIIAVDVDARADDAEKQIRRLTDGGVPAAIHFVGAETSATLGLWTLATGGLLVIVGLFGGQLSAALPLLPLRNLTIRGSYVGSLEEMLEMMALVQTGKVLPIPVRPRPLGDAQIVLNDLREGRAVGRMVLMP